MPKLLMFVPCEKVIHGEDHSTTLISLLHSLNVNVPSDAPPKIAVPMPWASFALWFREPTDIGVRYEQRVELIAPSGAVALSQVNEFEMTKPYHRQTNNVFGLPVPETGNYVLRLSLRRLGEETFTTVMDFPWTLDRITAGQPTRA